LPIILALAAAGILPPLALILVPGAAAELGPLPAAIPLIGALLLGPAAVLLVAALSGLDRVVERAGPDHEHAVLRVLAGAALLLYACAAARPGLFVAVLALGFAWAVLLHLVLSPAPAAWRRYGAIVADMALLSGFLHTAGPPGAAWFPLYLAASFYAGLRLGLAALAVSAVAALAGFAATAAATPFWQLPWPPLAGLFAGLAVLPALAGVLIRRLAASRADAAAAVAARERFVAVIGRGLRGPLEAIRHSEGDGALLPAPALLAQIGEVLDLATIEAGAFSPPTEGFDLHALVHQTLAPLRLPAAQHGITLALRLDPQVPYRLCGWPQQLAQILNSLLIEAIAASAAGTIRIDIAAAERKGGLVRLRLALRDRAGEGAPADPDLAADPLAAGGASAHGGFAVPVMRRLIELMGGQIAVAAAPGQGRRWTVTLPFALDPAAEAAALDLGGRPVLLVTEDSQFAGELAEPLTEWNADTRWIGGLDDALVYVERFETELAPILVVDGRARVLPALSFVHRAALARDEPPFVLFVADDSQVASLAELGDGEIAGLLPAPLELEVLENALHALPLALGPPRPAPLPAPPPEPAAVEPDDGRVTPIAAHPRFAAGTASVVDRQVVGALQALGGGEFFGEVIDGFAADAQAIMARLDAAAAAGDAVGFARAVQALRRSAAALGGARIVELAQALRDIPAVELRQHGAAIVQRLAGELSRLEAELREALPAAGERYS
jgi:signal transduction histidine kinase/HPt (histidine-containing phosphotransfer) domain-containing protein